MNYQEVLWGFSLIIWIICYIPYIRDIWRWTTKPHTISRFIWALTTGLGFFAQLYDGVWAGAWILGLFCTINTGIFLYALRKWETKINTLDMATLILALLALALRWITNSPLGSVILIIIADSLWFYPTFYKAYHEPKSESLSFWILTIISLILSLLAMNHWSFIGIGYTLTMIFWEILLVGLLIARTHKSLSHHK